MPSVGNLAFSDAKAQNELFKRLATGRKCMTVYVLPDE
jgi:hypothetical protein